MKKLILAVALAAMSLTACATTGTGKPPGPPSPVETLAPILAPLTGNHVTKEAIDLAFAASDAALYVIDFMRSVGWIEDGSPKALALADAAEILKRSLIVADTAQRAGEQAKADGAYSKAATAYSLILKALER